MRLVDPETSATFVLLPAELYEELQNLFGEDFHPSLAYPATDRAFREGWSDPKLDDYDRYEEFKQ